MFCGICFDLRQNPACIVATFICLNVSRDKLNKWENETEKKKEGSGLSSIKPESGKLTITSTTIQSLLIDGDQPYFLAL